MIPITKSALATLFLISFKPPHPLFVNNYVNINNITVLFFIKVLNEYKSCIEAIPVLLYEY